MAGSQLLVTHLYTADPSAHVFEGRIYVYPSHDVDTGVPASEDGDQFDMRDYHVLSMDRVGGEVHDHGPVLRLEDVAWASRQLWSNDVACKEGTYYMYFPAKDGNGVFRIGVATSRSPAGPFVAGDATIEGSYSIDPCAFEDGGHHYLCFGGIHGGQLQRWQTGAYDPDAGPEPEGDVPALGPRVARLREDMLGFDEDVREVRILDQSGRPLRASDHERRFFEAPWMHRYSGRYYLSYSTGDTHRIVYATADDPYGPFTYQGVILTPVLGWTTHHSIVEVDGTWYLFYHDSSLSGGETHLRSVKVTELVYRADGSIATIEGRAGARSVEA
jgi:hypothetical protein